MVRSLVDVAMAVVDVWLVVLVWGSEVEVMMVVDTRVVVFISVLEVARLTVDVWTVALVRGLEVEVMTADDN